MNNAYPLSWPPGWPRTALVQRSKFGDRSVHEAVDEVKRQLEMTGCTGLVISSNYTLGASPKDKGVCVYFQLKGRPYALPCDKWDCVEDNLWAISKHIESIRLQERWGVGSIERNFAGYLALPSSATVDANWWDVLGVPRLAEWPAIEQARRDKALLYHPDRTGGDSAKMAAVNKAFETAKEERRMTA